jgi:hypothetical protein
MFLFVSFTGLSVIGKKTSITENEKCIINASRQKRQALLIGMSDCTATKNDVDELEDSLLNHYWVNNEITKLYGTIKGNNVKEKLNTMASHSTTSTLSLFYYSGHGGRSIIGEFIATKQVFIYDYELLEILDKFKGKVVVILDTCHSGGMMESPKYSSKNAINQVILAACGKNAVTVVRPFKNHGAFTYRLLEGLNGKADENNDEIITAEEAFDYAKSKLLITPQIKDLNIVEDIPINGDFTLTRTRQKNSFFNDLLLGILNKYNIPILKYLQKL